MKTIFEINEEKFEERVQAYVDELRTDSVVSFSHVALRELNSMYGAKRVEAELQRHWAKDRESKARR